MLDVPWRVKLLLPCIASLPLLIAYSGGTAVGIPKPLRALLPALPPYLDIGPLYQLYMVRHEAYVQSTSLGCCTRLMPLVLS